MRLNGVTPNKKIRQIRPIRVQMAFKVKRLHLSHRNSRMRQTPNFPHCHCPALVRPCNFAPLRLCAPASLFLCLILLLSACAAELTPTPPLRVSTSVPTDAPPGTTPSPLPPTVTPMPGSGPGTVRGSVCYPSSVNPPLTLTFETTGGDKAVTLDIPAGQPEFVVNLPPGEYVAYAHTVGTGLRGSYSQAVPCGLTRNCIDHSLRPFSVPPGGEIAGIELCDWYRRPGVLPHPPDATDTTAVSVTTLQNMHLLNAPDLAEPPLQTLPAAVTAPATGRSKDNQWLHIEPPAGEPGWIYAPLTVIQGDPTGLPVLAAGSGPESGPPDQFTPARDRVRLPNSTVGHFRGNLLDAAGEPVNGYSLLLTNGTWSVLTHPSGPSHHYPNYTNGQWDMVLYNPAEGAGWWAITVVRYNCPNFEQGFNAQCKQFTLVSPTEVIRLVRRSHPRRSSNWYSPMPMCGRATGFANGTAIRGYIDRIINC